MNRMIRKIKWIAGWLILVATMVVVFAFSSRKMSDIKCNQIVIRYAGNRMIRLEEKTLTSLARSSNQKIIGAKMENIDTEAIEKSVLKNGAVLKADAYKTIVRDSSGYHGAITVKVRHRVPFLRVFSSNGSYYLDKTGNRIPTSVQYAADVPVATGNITSETAKSGVIPLVDFIQRNKFWKAQIKQIQVNSSGEMILTTLVGNQLIEFGTTDNMEKKFRNLKAFYEQVLKDNNWDKYSRIILKFENQVIARKN